MFSSISRRNLIAGASACAVAATTAALAHAEETAVWDMEADLVVIGSGGGLAGAITAAELGLDVLVLEKLDILGGSCALHSGVVSCGGGTSLQREAGLEDTPEQYRDFLLACAKGQANPALVEALANEIPQNFEWLRSLGVPFTTEWLYYTGPEQEPYCTAVTPAIMHGAQCPPDEAHRTTGIVIHSFVIAEAEAKGVQIITAATGKHLITNSAGDVIGIKAEIAGEPKNIKARKGVILNCGGMCNNPQMLAQYMRYGGIRYAAGTKGATGDGIKMGQEIGADLVNMHESLSSPNCAITLGTTTRGKERPAYPTILVNKFGQRFVNEDYHSDTVGKLMYGQEDCAGFQIFDSASIDACNAAFRDAVVEADTIEELAQALGIKVDGHVKTVNEWNEGARNGEDPAFGKTGATVAPLENPPFYGLQVWAYAIVAHFGGLKVDENCNVIRVDGSPINRLYACGIDAGGWMGRYYPGSGTSVGGSYSMARIAARNIAALENWE